MKFSALLVLALMMVVSTMGQDSGIRGGPGNEIEVAKEKSRKLFGYGGSYGV